MGRVKACLVDKARGLFRGLLREVEKDPSTHVSLDDRLTVLRRVVTVDTAECRVYDAHRPISPHERSVLGLALSLAGQVHGWDRMPRISEDMLGVRFLYKLAYAASVGFDVVQSGFLPGLVFNSPLDAHQAEEGHEQVALTGSSDDQGARADGWMEAAQSYNTAFDRSRGWLEGRTTLPDGDGRRSQPPPKAYYWPARAVQCCSCQAVDCGV